MRACLSAMVGCFWLFLTVVPSPAGPVDPPAKETRCPVCGMFVAKYTQWVAQIHTAGQEPALFDGVKDMLVYYFDPGAYGGSGDMTTAEIWVRNYYSLDYIDGRQAFYVVGSDTFGPMGDELIPFSSRVEAETFRKDHRGQKILTFAEVDAALVQGMKKKHMMNKKKMKGESKPN